MDKNLAKLFEIRKGKHPYMDSYNLIGTKFVYVHRQQHRWMKVEGHLLSYHSFEEVLDSVTEDIQTQLLFHLDFFLSEETKIGLVDVDVFG